MPRSTKFFKDIAKPTFLIGRLPASGTYEQIARELLDDNAKLGPDNLFKRMLLERVVLDDYLKKDEKYRSIAEKKISQAIIDRYESGHTITSTSWHSYGDDLHADRPTDWMKFQEQIDWLKARQSLYTKLWPAKDDSETPNTKSSVHLS